MANDEQPPSIYEAVARNVRHLRGERSQDEIAKMARSAGLPWSRQVIASIEAGTRELDLPEAVLFAWALQVGVQRLLAGEGVVRLNESATASLKTVREISRQSKIDLPIAAVDTPGWRALSNPDQPRWATPAELERFQQLAPGVNAVQAEEVELAALNVPEIRAASKLGVSSREIGFASIGLWGRTLSAERDRRAGELAGPAATPASRQAFRGRVTRQLLGELAERLRKD